MEHVRPSTKQTKIFLDDEFRNVVLWNNEFTRNINQVSFPSDIGYFDTSPNLKLDILISSLLQMHLGKILSFSKWEE